MARISLAVITRQRDEPGRPVRCSVQSGREPGAPGVDSLVAATRRGLAAFVSLPHATYEAIVTLVRELSQ